MRSKGRRECKMRYKHFKNADVRVSVLGLGSWGNGGADAQGNNFYGRFTEEDCLKAMDVLIGEGVNRKRSVLIRHPIRQ